MQTSNLQNRTPFARCQQTSIADDFLEALVTNKRRTERYGHINPITGGGHGRHFEARQILTFLLRKALSIVRIPGTYDLPLQTEHFSRLTVQEIDSACEDILRIYNHTQFEMLQHANTIKLVRGVCGIEADVCAALLEEIEEEEIPFFFQTVTFFNHVCGGFSRQITVTVECPVPWVWASAYTLKDLELPGSDEEVMVVCQSHDGVLRIPRASFEITPSPYPIEDVILPTFSGRNKFRHGLPEALSALMQEGLEPDYPRRIVAYYKPGCWESRLAQLGRKLDSLGSARLRRSVSLRSRGRP